MNNPIHNHDLKLNFRFFWQVGNTALCLKKCHKNERNMCLVTHVFINFSQNVCLISTHILIYCHARCNYKLWKAHWFRCVFKEFSYIIDDHSCLKCCIFTKLSHIVRHILVCQHARCDFRLWKVFWFKCVCEFSNIITCFKRYIFIKVSQIQW